MTFSVFLISISFLRHSCIVSQRFEALVCLCVHSCKVINEIRGGIYRRGSSPSRLSPFYIFFGLASLKEKRKAASEQILTESFRPTFLVKTVQRTLVWVSGSFLKVCMRRKFLSRNSISKNSL